MKKNTLFIAFLFLFGTQFITSQNRDKKVIQAAAPCEGIEPIIAVTTSQFFGWCMYTLEYENWEETGSHNYSWLQSNSPLPSQNNDLSFFVNSSEEIVVTLSVYDNSGNTCGFASVTLANCEVILDECKSCEKKVDFEFNPNTAGCTWSFDGININDCIPDLGYAWTVDYDVTPTGGNVVGYEEDLTYTFSSAGIKKVCFSIVDVDEFGQKCITEECEFIFVNCSGRFSKDVIVYPNPAKSNSELQFEGIDIKEVKSIELFDFSGNLKMKLNPKMNSFKLPQIQSGLYIVKFYTSKGIEEKKLIIE